MTRSRVSSDARALREQGIQPQRRLAVSRRRLLKGSTVAAGVAAAGLTVAATQDVSAWSGRGAPGTRIEVDRGVFLQVEDWGSGKPIVLIHGWPSSHRIFERQMLALANRGYRVVGIDLRGFGQSDTPWDGNDYDTWARDIGRVIDTLGLRDVTLVGYSMGGAIAAHFMATYKHARVDSLALLAAAAPLLSYREDNPHGLPPEMFDAMLAAIMTDRAAFFHDFMPSMFHSPVSAAYLAWFEDIVMSGSLRAIVRGLEEGRDRDLREELAAIEVPTTIIHGLHDQVVPFALAEAQHERINGSTLVTFENSGHGLFTDEPDRLVDELAAFAG